MEETTKSPKQDLVSTNHAEILEREPSRGNLRKAKEISVSEQHTMSVQSEDSSDLTVNSKAGPASYKKHYTNNKSKTWEASYSKSFVCRLCDKHCKSRGNINLHFKKHRTLVNNYRNTFKKYCTIKLGKCDNKPNVTGTDETVVLNPDKIVRDEGKMHYYILYTLNEQCRKMEVKSDSDDDFAPVVHGKRRRLLSTSSTDTLILNNTIAQMSPDHEEKTKLVINKDKKAIVPKVMECIDLDDSSDDSTHSGTTMPSKSNMTVMKTTDNERPLPELTDHKTISKLVSASQTKYLRQLECTEEQVKQFASNKNKLLNIGLKAIFQQGYKCTGLLRYLEHEHLEIKWKPINAVLRTQMKENKYVRIMPRVKGKEDINQDDAQWKKITDHNFMFLKEGTTKPIQVQKKISVPIIETLVRSNSSTNPIVNGQSKSDPALSDCAVLYSNTTIEADKKLLNASPVANPKQLPKKCVPFETKASPVPTVTEAIVVPSPVAHNESLSAIQPMSIDSDDLINVDNGCDNLCMPIIMSTTSLAPGNNTTYNREDATVKEGSNATPNSNGVNYNQLDGIVEQPPASLSKKPAAPPPNKPAATVTPAPRIKVKNVAELMSEHALSQQNAINTTQSNNIWLVPLENPLQVTNVSVNNNSSNGVSTLTQPATSSLTQPATSSLTQPATSSLTQPATSSQVISPLATVPREYVVLDTVEMPNTKTSAPFKYLQSLMQMHNIALLDGTEQLPKDFHCLIKFKLQFSQQSIHKPVVLCLSLHCLANKFYLGVKDPNHPGNIDLNKLSANWQWEILKIYTVRELVVNKLYQNAQKINPAVFGYVKIFVSILQTIQLKSLCSSV